MDIEESFPTLGGIYFLPGTQINSWLKCGTQSLVDKKTGALLLADDDGMIVLEKDCAYYANDLKSRNRSLSKASIYDENSNSSKNLHVKQDQNWLSKSFRRLSIASSTPPNLSTLKLNDLSSSSQESPVSTKGHTRNYSASSSSSTKEKTLFQSIRLKMKKNQQYHSNDLLLNVSHDDVVYKANRRCSNYSVTLGRKDMDTMLAAKKLRNSQTCRNFEAELKSPDKLFDSGTVFNNRKGISFDDDYKPRCIRVGIVDNSISKNIAIQGKTVTHEYLPEMDIVCGYIQLEFEGEDNVIPVYATLYDYELILFEDDTCKDEIFRITTEGCSAYNEPKLTIEIKVDSKKGKDKGKNENKEVEIEEKQNDDFSFTLSTSQGTFKIRTINNSSMIRWMATINTASSNISLALHLSSQHQQQNSDSIFDESDYNKNIDHSLDIYNKEYIALVRDFNTTKVDINKEIQKSTKKGTLKNQKPSPTVYGTPDELMNKNIPIIEIASKNDKDSVKSHKKKEKRDKISDLESKFKTVVIKDCSNSLDNIDSNNFLDCSKLGDNSPIFNMDCVSMPILNKNDSLNDLDDQSGSRLKKEIELERDDVVGEINNKHYRQNKSKRLSSATITSVSSYSSRCTVDDEDIHFEENSNNKEGNSNTTSSIYCATPEKLIECIWAGEETPDSNFLDIIVYTYRHFTTGDYVMDKLIAKFQEKLPPNSNSFLEEDFLLWKPVIMIRIANFIKRWLTLTSVDFRVESIRKKLDSFIRMLSNISVFENGEPLYSYMLYKDLSSLQKLFTRFTNETLPEIDFSPKEIETPNRSKLPEFINLDPTNVAYKLTAMEAERFQKIKPIEFILNLWNTNDQSPYIQHEMKNLKEMVEASNHLSYWVTTEILTQPQLKPRAKVLEMFIKIAHICKKLNNYQTLFSICSGLGHSQVTRLKMTWEAIQPKYKSRFNDLEKITSIARNYNTYRQIHANLLDKDKNTSHYIPFIALLIKDLYFFNDGNPKYIDESKLKSLKEDNESMSMNGNESTSMTGNEATSTSGNEVASLNGNEFPSLSGSNKAPSFLAQSIKSAENDISSFLTSSTSNFSLNQDFGLECIDEVESNCDQFDKADGALTKGHEEEEEKDNEEMEDNMFESKSEGDIPSMLHSDKIEQLTNKVLSVESTSSTVTITTTATQLVNFDKLKKIIEQIRKIEHCQCQSKNFVFNNVSVDEIELPCNYYHILSNDKVLNKYSLLCEQREGQPVRMVSKWVEDNK